MSCDYHLFPHPGIQSLTPYKPGKSAEELAEEQGLTDIIKMASNENPLGCSPLAKVALSALTEKQIATYPSTINHPLRHKLSQYLGLDEQKMTLSNGSDAIFSLLLTTFALHTTKHMVTHEYAFISYSIQAQALGIPIVISPVKPDWQVDMDALINTCNSNTALVFLANPNNPTGQFINLEEIKRLLNNLPVTVIVVLDEAYYEYAYPLNDHTSLDLLEQYPNLVITRTFSKIHGLAGLRLGYALANPVISELLQRVQAPFAVNCAALEAAYAALDDHDFIQQTLTANREGMQQMQQGLTDLGLAYASSHCNFVTFDCGMNSAIIYQALLSKGIIVRPLQAYGLPNHLRVTIGTKLQNDRFLATMSHCLTQSLKEFQHEK